MTRTRDSIGYGLALSDLSNSIPINTPCQANPLSQRSIVLRGGGCLLVAGAEMGKIGTTYYTVGPTAIHPLFYHSRGQADSKRIQFGPFSWKAVEKLTHFTDVCKASKCSEILK